MYDLLLSRVNITMKVYESTLMLFLAMKNRLIEWVSQFQQHNREWTTQRYFNKGVQRENKQGSYDNDISRYMAHFESYMKAGGLTGTVGISYRISLHSTDTSFLIY